MVVHTENAKPKPEAKYSMFEITEGATFYFGTSIKVGIKFIYTDLVWKAVEMQCYVSNRASIIGEQAIAELLNGYLFQKKLPAISKSYYVLTSLLYNSVVTFFLNVI